jgi:serine O-acetyltransferase
MQPLTIAPLPSLEQRLADATSEPERGASNAGLFDLLAEDFRTHDRQLSQPGFWAVAVHRMGTRVASLPSPLLRRLLAVPQRVLSVAIDWTWGIQIPAEVSLGRRVRLCPSGGMLLAARSIGNDVNIRHGTTFGTLRGTDQGRDSLPVIEDHVDVGSGVSILGPVVVGRNAVISPNSVVLRDVAPGARVLGVPARAVTLLRETLLRDSSRDLVPAPDAQVSDEVSAEAISLRELLTEDFRTHDASLLEPGFWAIAIHRVGERASAIESPAFRLPLNAAAGALSTAADWAFGIKLHRGLKLGRRVRLWHRGGIQLAARSIGNDVHLRPNTTFGAPGEASNDPSRWPTIGDRADIGAGACVLGNVRVGEGAFVGANALITEDVPACGLVVGVPGRLLQLPGRKPAMAPEPSAEPSSSKQPTIKGKRDQNPKDIGLLALLGEDLATYEHRWSAPGFWAVALHRFGNWRMGVQHKALRAPLTLAYRTGFQLVRSLWGIDLPYDVKLGRRVRLDHHGSITIGARAIGNDVVIRHSVVLGVLRRGDGDEKPTIGDRVELGPRACVVGAVTIGDDTLVCANTVVPINVPAHSTVLGVPARIVDLDRQLAAAS